MKVALFNKITGKSGRYTFLLFAFAISPSKQLIGITSSSIRSSKFVLSFTSSSSTRITSTTTSTSNLSMSSNTMSKKSVVIDPFCFRQFSEHESSHKYSGTIFHNISIKQFEDIVNERFQETSLKDGYAPFCKHIFIKNDFLISPNDNNIKVNALSITKENEHLLRTRYEARNDKELPVLTRYFPKEHIQNNIELPTATYFDIIMYSREQIQKENSAQDHHGIQEHNDKPWGIVSIKAQDLDNELPMNPITAMRNALGVEEGGSGIPLNREAYMDAVNYWKDRAIIS